MIKTLFKISDLWILLGFLVIYIAVFDTKIDVGGDNAGYYILGKSISSGLGYTDIHLPNANPANHFPPGYPIILSVFMNFSDGFVFLKSRGAASGLLFFFHFCTVWYLNIDKRFCVLYCTTTSHQNNKNSKKTIQLR